MWVKGLIEKFNLKLLSPQTISADMISLTIKKQNEPCPPPKTKQNSLSIIEAWHSPLLDHVISWYEKEKFLRWEQQKGLHSIRNYWAFPPLHHDLHFLSWEPRGNLIASPAQLNFKQKSNSQKSLLSTVLLFLPCID